MTNNLYLHNDTYISTIIKLTLNNSIYVEQGRLATPMVTSEATLDNTSVVELDTVGN